MNVYCSLYQNYTHGRAQFSYSNQTEVWLPKYHITKGVLAFSLSCSLSNSAWTQAVLLCFTVLHSPLKRFLPLGFEGSSLWIGPLGMWLVTYLFLSLIVRMATAAGWLWWIMVGLWENSKFKTMNNVDSSKRCSFPQSVGWGSAVSQVLEDPVFIRPGLATQWRTSGSRT